MAVTKEEKLGVVATKDSPKIIKESHSSPAKANVKVTAIRAMTAEEEGRLTVAIDALLAYWAQRHIGRHIRGKYYVQSDGH